MKCCQHIFMLDVCDQLTRQTLLSRRAFVPCEISWCCGGCVPLVAQNGTSQ